MNTTKSHRRFVVAFFLSSSNVVDREEDRAYRLLSLQLQQLNLNHNRYNQYDEGKLICAQI